MLIENPDAFNSWLTAVLEPLCDADPAALAKYIYALVKKDKPLDDLRDGMLDQLDVFLQQETKPFVELLFKSLETKEYLEPAAGEQPSQEKILSASPVAADKSSKTPTDTEDVVASSKQSYGDLRDEKLDAPPIRNDKKESLNTKEKEIDSRSRHNDSSKKDVGGKHRIVLNRTTKFIPAIVPKEKPAYATEQTLVKIIPDLLEASLNEQLPTRNSRRDRKSDSDKEERRRRPHRSRSRSRSWDRSRRPPSGGRPLWRNRSPPLNRYERRRSRSGSPPVRVPRYRNRSPPIVAETDIPPSRSRSRSRERPVSPVPNLPRERLDRVSRERDRDRQSRNRDRVDRDKVDRDRERIDRERERDERRGRDSVSGTATPTQDSNPGDSANQPRGTTTLAGIFAPSQKKRCRDFDEKGYCMRGDLCQFDHGADPVVLEDPTLSQVLALPISRPPPRVPAPGCISEYNPLAPDIWTRGGIYAAPPPQFFPFFQTPPLVHHPVQRELISIPTVRIENVPPNGTSVPPPMSAPMGNPAAPPASNAPSVPLNNHITPSAPSHVGKKKSFDFTRLGPNRHHHMNKTPGGNCSLELKKIPSGLNDIMHLNNHFSKFGKIVNIQVCYEDDPEAALITFSSHTEANVAYKSTEAVLNNRFIKVFWHNSEQNKQENSIPGQRTSVKDRLTSNHTHINNNSINHVLNNKVLINKDPNKIVNNISDKTAAPKKESDAAVDGIKNGEEITSAGGKEQSGTATENVKPEVPPTAELAAMVKKRGENAMKIIKDLRRRSQQLLDKQLEHQRTLLQRLESGTVTGIQKEKLIETIKQLQLGIEKTRKDIVATPKPANNQMKKAGFGNLKKVPRSKEETQKEILDAELDLFTKQQEGQDVSELQKRVAELRRQQLALKTSTPVRRAPVNRISSRGRFAKTAVAGKPGLFVNQSVDHRPRSFLVSGYEADELDQLTQHFTQFGEIVDSLIDPTTPSLWLQFKSRKVAEQAATKGRQFNDRTLTVTWQQRAVPSTPQTQADKNNDGNAASIDDQINFNASSPSYSNLYDSENWPSKSNPTTSISQKEKNNMDNFNAEEIFLAPSPKLDWEFSQTSPSFHFPDSEDDEGKDDEKEEDRSWRR